MQIKTIVLDVQHMGKPHNPLDRGATHRDLIESDLCLQYASQVFKQLTALWYKPFLITHSYYGQRAIFANQIEADLYLACHLNSSERPPNKNYSLVEISEYAGQTTHSFAQHLVCAFKEKLPVDKSTVKIIREGERGWSCINRIKAPALLLEPFFINYPEIHDHVTKHIWQVSDAIVHAVKTFKT